VKTTSDRPFRERKNKKGVSCKGWHGGVRRKQRADRFAKKSIGKMIGPGDYHWVAHTQGKPEREKRTLDNHVISKNRSKELSKHKRGKERDPGRDGKDSSCF